MTTLEGIDISHYQSGLSIAKAGVDFAIMKATDGTSMVDKTCDGFVTQCKKAGVLFGVYHFAHTGSDAEADFFVKNTAGYHGEGILVLDWEADAVGHGVGAAKNWLDRVYAKTGVRPLIYMSESVARDHDWSSVAKDYALWVARYGTSSYGDVGAFGTAAMWQYTSSGRVSGYSGNVDKDHFYGSREAWAAFAAGSNTPAPTPDPAPDPTPEDEMKYKGFETHTATQALTSDEWTTIHIDDDKNMSVVATQTGGLLFDALVQLTLTGLPVGAVAQVRWVGFDVDSGVKAVAKQTYPITEIVGTDGSTFGQAAQLGKLNKPGEEGPDGRLLRAQIMVFDDGVVIKAASARALYQD